jgi:hypothetical protein
VPPLFVLAIGMPIAAFQAIFGVAGTAIGVLPFVVIGNPFQTDPHRGHADPATLPSQLQDAGLVGPR